MGPGCGGDGVVVEPDVLASDEAGVVEFARGAALNLDAGVGGAWIGTSEFADAAGFAGTTWPTTSQSNSARIAARLCFTVGADRTCPDRGKIRKAGTVRRPGNARKSGYP